jgi:uncharacterized membrane protein YczE
VTIFQVLKVRAIPQVSWSAPHPLTIQIRWVTWIPLLLGLALFGLGEAILVAAGVGVSPWTVLAEGVALTTRLSIGWASLLISGLVLLLWIPLRQMPGVGTLCNAVIISAMLEGALPYLPRPDGLWSGVIMAALGIAVIGLGSGLYLIANCGPGPRDGLMTGIQRRTGWPVAAIRGAIEVTVVSLGFVLGGTVGVGTLMFALGVGPAVAIGLSLVGSLAIRWDQRVR